MPKTPCLGAEGRLSTLHGENRRLSELRRRLKGVFGYCACAKCLPLAAAAIACAEEERRARAQKIEVASAALGSMVGGWLCALQVPGQSRARRSPLRGGRRIPEWRGRVCPSGC